MILDRFCRTEAIELKRLSPTDPSTQRPQEGARPVAQAKLDSIGVSIERLEEWRGFAVQAEFDLMRGEIPLSR